MYIERELTSRLKSLVEHFPVVVVSGARQVGKSTLLNHVFADQAEIYTFDPIQDIGNAREDPDLFLDNCKLPVILDEIQYIPELVPAIKRRVDHLQGNGHFLLTGSQQWSVMKELAESLAGRAAFLDLSAFSLNELSQQPNTSNWLEYWLEKPGEIDPDRLSRLPASYSLYEQLWRGFMPRPAISLPTEHIPDFYEGYQRTYIERDIRSMMDVSDVRRFARFHRLTAALSAQEINYNELGRDLGMSPKTAQRWLDMLIASFQWFEVPPFTMNPVKRVSGKPKGYIADTGLACWLLGIPSPVNLGAHPLWGSIFETAVVNEIQKLLSRLSTKPRLYHWRAYSGGEVDLILEYNGRMYPIEVKAASQPSRRATTGITSFRKHYPNLPIAPGLILAPTDRYAKISPNDYVMPWDAVLLR